MTVADAAVVARGVTLAYGARVALAAVDLELPAGRITAVIGPNGSGKSTLLNAIAGLVTPATGELTVLGVTPREARRRVAYVLQSTKVNEVMPVTVWEVVGMGRYALGGFLPRFGRDDRSAIAAALRRLDIVDLSNRHLGELSGGQRQRVFVAQGLVQDAPLLLLDEPVTGLDMVSKERILQVMEEERAKGRTVVVTTHDLGEAQRADHVVLCAGRVVAAGPPGVVLTPSRLADAYGGLLVQPALARAARAPALVLDDPHHAPAGVTRELHPHSRELPEGEPQS